MEINFATVGGDFAPISEGRYVVKCLEAKLGTSQAGNEMINCTFEIVGNDDYKNRKVWHTFSLVQKALFNLKNYLQACDNELVNSPSADSAEVVKALVGTSCTAFMQPAKTNTGKDVTKLSNWTAVVAEGEDAGMFS
tara:strand:- start:110 stop:520 length:411 start_codon:yes stop_codon:yes gene_type:complete